MTAAHSPAPWRNVQDGTGDPCAIYSRDGDIVAEYVINAADAQLLAAAPAMHDALRAIVAEVDAFLSEIAQAKADDVDAHRSAYAAAVARMHGRACMALHAAETHGTR